MPITASFWEACDTLLASSETMIDRPKGTAHPRYPDLIYPFDYGYLVSTVAGDGDGIDLFIGSLLQPAQLIGILCTLDQLKRDMEIKLLINCTDQDVNTIVNFLNSEYMSVMYIARV